MTEREHETGLSVYTVGHSNQEMEEFLDLLRLHSIEVVTDVRSSPYSRYASQFNRENLRQSLLDAGFRYVFLGEELGGRPSAPEFYDEEGHVLYGNVAESEVFRTGLDRLTKGISQYRVAMMCSEEDPTHCHRRLLISRVLFEKNIQITHIRGDGSTESEQTLRVKAGDDPAAPRQGSLFGGEERAVWRSTLSVSPRNQRRSSLDSFETQESEPW